MLIALLIHLVDSVLAEYDNESTITRDFDRKQRRFKLLLQDRTLELFFAVMIVFIATSLVHREQTVVAHDGEQIFVGANVSDTGPILAGVFLLIHQFCTVKPRILHVSNQSKIDTV